VLLALVTLVPLALGMYLLVFGVPERPFLAPTPRNLAGVGIAAVVVGPVAQLLLGFGGWLVLIGLLVGCVLLVAGLGPGGRRALHQ